jgi:hypothetical protein
MRIFSAVVCALSIIALTAPAVPASSQDAAKSVQVSFRVQDGGRFVDDLRIEDLEVLENGVPQTVQGLYLSDRGRVVRSEGDAAPPSRPGRHFIIYFQMTEFDPKIEEAFNYLFNEMLTENDELTIITPQKPYQLAAEAFKARARKDLAKDMLKLVRKDIMAGAGEYRSLINELRRIARSIQGGPGSAGGFEAEGDAATDEMGLEFSLPRYKQVLERVEKIRFADQTKFLEAAESLRRAVKPTQVFFFYQREFRPTISADILSQIYQNNQERPDIQAELNELFTFYKREFNFDVDRVGKALADAGTPFYALFLDRKAKNAFGIVMAEQSEDMFRIFRAVTKATGGGVDISENPASSLKKIAAMGNPFYVLAYTPSVPPGEGSFREIKVRVKDRPYTVVHRAGYYAR